MKNASDQELLLAYNQGDEAAFSELMERHSTAVKAYALRMLRNPEQAEDILSETFLRIAMGKGRWEDRGFSFRSYLFTIANNLCIDVLRRHQVARKAAQGVLELTLHQQLRPSPEAEAILGQRASQLEQAIGKLSEAHRQVILLRSIHGFSAKECSAVLQCEAHQVDSMLSYARKKLREQLTILHEQPQSRYQGGER